MDFSAYIDGISRLSACRVECYEIPITTAEIKDVMMGRTRGKSLCLDGLPMSFYMSDLFIGLYLSQLAAELENP